MPISKKSFLNLLGELPTVCEPVVELLEEVECDGIIRQKISYNVENSERISAYLCFPKAVKANSPAVFCHHQHAGNHQLGKSEVVGIEGDASLAYAKELAQQGYVTLAPDAIAFEERGHATDPNGYHHHLLKRRLLQGKTLLGKTLHDISAGISILEQLEFVDSKKIGFIGHSYGGRAALFAPVFDERITASVSVCGCTSFRTMLENETGIQPDYCVPGFLRFGDIADVVSLFDDCALCLIAATDDQWSRDSQEIFHTVKGKFVLKELFVREYQAGHVFNNEMKSDAYAFLDRNLKED